MQITLNFYSKFAVNNNSFSIMLNPCLNANCHR